MRDFTPFIHREKKRNTTEQARSEPTSLELDDELTDVLEQLCTQLGLTSHEEALNVLVKQRLNGSLRDVFLGQHRPPRLSVIKGGRS